MAGSECDVNNIFTSQFRWWWRNGVCDPLVPPQHHLNATANLNIAADHVDVFCDLSVLIFKTQIISNRFLECHNESKWPPQVPDQNPTEWLLDVVRQEIYIVDVQPKNLQQLCDAMKSTWTKMSVSCTLLNLYHEKVSQFWRQGRCTLCNGWWVLLLSRMYNADKLLKVTRISNLSLTWHLPEKTRTGRSTRGAVLFTDIWISLVNANWAALCLIVSTDPIREHQHLMQCSWSLFVIVKSETCTWIAR